MKAALTLLTLPLLLLMTVTSCNQPAPPSSIGLKPGDYTLCFLVGETEIPVRLSVNDNKTWSIHNWTETIQLDSITYKGNEFHVMMPLFNTTLSGTILNDSTLSGTWVDHSRDSLYSISFKGCKTWSGFSNISESSTDTLIYAATFSPDSEEDRSNAIGKFYRKGNVLVGTFLTESGDYRFLEGSHTGQSIQLSSFDGTHLFYFCANVNGNELTDGHFYSGNHWSEDWVAQINQAAKLRNPDSLTFVKEENISFGFHVKSATCEEKNFDAAAFRDLVTIIQLFGSWCPNCTDESLFLKELYTKYHSAGLNIIPVAFERTADCAGSMAFVKQQFIQLDLEYEPCFGGKKGTANDIFPMLNNVSSYPTMIFVDHTGNVRKIHTGFYGPSTGEDYTQHCKELTNFIEQLINEIHTTI